MAEDVIVKKIEGAPERTVEKTAESSPLEKQAEEAARRATENVSSAPSAKPLPSTVVKVKTPEQLRAEKIDQILSEGLSDIFMDLSPKKQMEFKVEGERTVRKINELLSEAKIKVKKIVDLILRWLRVIPDVNPFFLEQEAKIKTDKILKLKE